MSHCLLLLIRRDLPLRGLHRDEFVAFYFRPLAACPSLAYLWLVCWVQLLFAHRYLVRESSDHLRLLQSLSEALFCYCLQHDKRCLHKSKDAK